MTEHRLYRSRSDLMLGGVCGGIAAYFEMDPSVVRLLAVILAVVGNAGAVIAYIVMWIVVPEEPLEGAGMSAETPASAPDATVPAASAPASGSPAPAPAPAASPAPATTVYAPPTQTPLPSAAHRGPRRGLIWFGVLLIVLGASLLVDRILPGLDLWGFWPATLLGLFLIAAGIRTMVTREEDD